MSDGKGVSGCGPWPAGQPDSSHFDMTKLSKYYFELYTENHFSLYNGISVVWGKANRIMTDLPQVYSPRHFS
jgi:hypothetical protein